VHFWFVFAVSILLVLLPVKLFFSNPQTSTFEYESLHVPGISVISNGSFVRVYIYTELKKQDTKLLPITSPSVNRFSKFFHWQTP